MVTSVREIVIQDFLKGLRFCSAWTGYKMLCLAVSWYMEDNRLTAEKDIYPRLAREFGGIEVYAVYQNIHYSIGKAFALGERAQWERIFPGQEKAPSNMLFISTAAEYLKKRGEEWK